MTTDVKAYVHISELDKKGEEKHSAQPPKTVDKMQADGEQYKRFNQIKYNETSYDNLAEFIEQRMPDGSEVPEAVKVAIANRGWVLYQQAAAKALVIDDDSEYTTVDEQTQPIDISGVALSPKEGRAKGTPETRFKKSMYDMLMKDPAKLRQMIAEFDAEHATSA